MATTYHIGDIFKVRGKRALAVIVKVNEGPSESYAVSYIDPVTHEKIDSGGSMPHAAWWSANELQKTFNEVKIFKGKTK